LRFARGPERPRPWTQPNTAIRITQINPNRPLPRSSYTETPTSDSGTASRANTAPTNERSAHITEFRYFFRKMSEIY